MPDQIDEQIKAARSEKLIALGHDMSKEFRKFYIGKNEEVLFEEKAVIGDKEYFVGYTKEYVKVAKETDVYRVCLQTKYYSSNNKRL